MNYSNVCKTPQLNLALDNYSIFTEILLSQLYSPDTDRSFAGMTDLQALLMQLDGEKQFDLLPCRAKLNLIKISAITGFIRNKIHRKIQQKT